MKGRVVGVDYGKKRVGLALADPLRIVAAPFGTFDPRRAVEALQRLHAEERIEVLVVGWPLQLDGSEGEATRPVQEYINRLRNIFPEATIVKWDERFTSEIAASLMREARPRRRPKKEEGSHDAAAAAVILQDYLDR